MSNSVDAAGVTVADDFIEFAHKLADLAGDVIRPHFRARGAIDNKEVGGFDPVTEADRGAEEVMRRLIEAQFPSHGILGEEFDDKPAAGPYRWVLDPIDGTKAFIIGMPTWGTLIGLTHEGVPALGMMDQPYIGERFWNSRAGAHFRGPAVEQMIETRRCASLSEAVLTTTSPRLLEAGELERFDALSAACRMTRYGGDCYSYCLLAMGLVDVVAEAGLKPFDIAPLIPIIRAAGGLVSTWDGGDAAKGGQILAVGDPSLHEAAMRALAG